MNQQTGGNDAILSLEMDKQFHPTLYWACEYLYILGLKSNHVSKGAPHNNVIVSAAGWKLINLDAQIIEIHQGLLRLPEQNKCCHFDEIVNISCTSRCHFESFWCSYSQKFCPPDSDPIPWSCFMRCILQYFWKLLHIERCPVSPVLMRLHWDTLEWCLSFK